MGEGSGRPIGPLRSASPGFGIGPGGAPSMPRRIEMKRKDFVVQAMDNVAAALRALIRINYENEKQASNAIFTARAALFRATNLLIDAEKDETAG